MLERLRQLLMQKHADSLPPVVVPQPAPRIHTTPASERLEIDQRLQGVQSRIAVLLAEVGLEERRARGKGSNASAL